MSKQPFNWAAYAEMMESCPEFQLLESFSFDHLSAEELIAVGDNMLATAEEYLAEYELVKSEIQKRLH